MHGLRPRRYDRSCLVRVIIRWSYHHSTGLISAGPGLENSLRLSPHNMAPPDIAKSVILKHHCGDPLQLPVELLTEVFSYYVESTRHELNVVLACSPLLQRTFAIYGVASQWTHLVSGRTFAFPTPIEGKDPIRTASNSAMTGSSVVPRIPSPSNFLPAPSHA